MPDGAVAFAIDHYVGTRVSRAFFGVETLVPYRAGDPEHLRRKHKVVRHPVTLEPSLDEIFSVVLPKVQAPTPFTGSSTPTNLLIQNVQVSEAKEYRSSYSRSYKTLQDIESSAVLSLGVVRYRGNSNTPQWMDTDPGMRPPLRMVLTCLNSSLGCICLQKTFRSPVRFKPIFGASLESSVIAHSTEAISLLVLT